MKDEDKAKEQLINELVELRQGIAEMEALEKERKRAKEETKFAYEELNQIFNTAADGMRVVDRDLNILRVNQTFLTLAGVSKEEAIGKKCYEVFGGAECHTPDCPLARILGGEKRIRYESEKQRKDGIKMPCIVTATPFRAPGGELIGIVKNYRDITEQKRTDEEIKLAYEELNQIFNTAADGMRVVDRDLNILRVNRTFLTLAGVSKEEAIGKKCYEVFGGAECHTPDCPLARILGGEKRVEYESEKERDDGVKIACIITATPFRGSGGDPVGIVENFKDITERKLVEEHIHVLSQELLKAQENARLMIAHNLHDRVAQDLSTVKIACQTLFDNQPTASPEVMRRVSDLTKILQRSIMAVRDLAYDLRPPSLDQLGLLHAVFQYCQDFSDKSGVSVDFYSAGLDELKLNFDTAVNLYRLIQEGLNNVRRHANARHVIVRLVASLPNIIVRIEDDGKGFDVKERLLRAITEKRLGLCSMQERVRLLEGKMRIRSRPQKGTRIFIEVPYKEKKSGAKQNHIDR